MSQFCCGTWQEWDRGIQKTGKWFPKEGWWFWAKLSANWISVHEQKGSSQQRDITNRLHGSLKGAVHWSFSLECHHEREKSRTQDSRDAYYKQVGNKMQYSIKRFLSYPHIIEILFLKSQDQYNRNTLYEILQNKKHFRLKVKVNG